MSLAIKFGDSTDVNSVAGAIYFDAVTNYNKKHSGKVTEHPIEAGAMVSDHYVSNNPIVKISGVVSHVDLSSASEYVYLDGEPVINQKSQPVAVRVSNIGSVLKNYIPGVVSQFLPNLLPDVIAASSESVNHKDSIEMLLRELLSGLYYNEQRKRWENRMTTTTLYEIDGVTPNPVFTDLIITDFTVDESVDTGDALVFELTGEKVRFVTLEKAEAPKPAPKSPTERATSDNKNKGNVPSTSKSPSTPREEGVLDKARRAGRPR